MTAIPLFTIGGVAVNLAQALSVAGAAVGALGAISGAQASANAAEFNAEMAEREAAQERQIAEQQARDKRREGSRILAASRARRAGSGVTSSGTPLLFDEATAAEIELQAQYLLAGGENRASSLEASAALDRSKAKGARSGGFLSAGTTLLTGAGNAFG